MLKPGYFRFLLHSLFIEEYSAILLLKVRFSYRHIHFSVKRGCYGYFNYNLDLTSKMFVNLATNFIKFRITTNLKQTALLQIFWQRILLTVIDVVMVTC